MYEGNPSSLAGMCEQKAMIDQPMDMVTKLKYEKSSLESRLNDVNAAIKALEKNPEVMEAINCISKVRNIGY